MKNIFFIILILMQFSVFGQIINGKWQMVSYEDDEIYYHKIKDSILIKNYEKDPEEIDGLKNLIAELVFARTFNIDSEFIHMVGPVKGELKTRYKVDLDASTLILLPEEEGIKKDYWPFRFVGKNLLITMPMENDSMILELKRS